MHDRSRPSDKTAEAHTVQVHLRLRLHEAELLRKLARERDQTLSAVVGCLVRAGSKAEAAPMDVGPGGLQTQRASLQKPTAE